LRRPRWGKGTFWLAALFLLAAAAPWIAPYPPELQEDVAGARFLPPLTRAHAIRIDPIHVRIVTSLKATEAGYEFSRAGKKGSVRREDMQEEPSARTYFLGTDQLGRDVASRLLFGARHSLGIAAVSVAIALAVGAGLGGLAGLARPPLGATVMWGVDVVRCVPRLLVYLLCAALFSPSTLLVVLVMGMTTWTPVARLVRAQILALRDSGLATAARALGASAGRTFLRHLVPQITPLLVVSATLRFADTVLLESALSLLGLGSPAPAVSLGSLMASGQGVLADAWWISACPGLLLCVTLLALRSGAAEISRIADPPSLV
jgi:peptide/nickel transport system permease protein